MAALFQRPNGHGADGGDVTLGAVRSNRCPVAVSGPVRRKSNRLFLLLFAAPIGPYFLACRGRLLAADSGPALRNGLAVRVPAETVPQGLPIARKWLCEEHRQLKSKGAAARSPSTKRLSVHK